MCVGGGGGGCLLADWTYYMQDAPMYKQTYQSNFIGQKLYVVMSRECPSLSEFSSSFIEVNSARGLPHSDEGLVFLGCPNQLHVFLT